MMKKYFSMGFFKVQLLDEENRFEAVPERFRQLKRKKTQGEKKGHFFLTLCPRHIWEAVPVLRMVS